MGAKSTIKYLFNKLIEWSTFIYDLADTYSPLPEKQAEELLVTEILPETGKAEGIRSTQRLADDIVPLTEETAPLAQAEEYERV